MGRQLIGDYKQVFKVLVSIWQVGGQATYWRLPIRWISYLWMNLAEKFYRILGRKFCSTLSLKFYGKFWQMIWINSSFVVQVVMLVIPCTCRGNHLIMQRLKGLKTG